MAAENHPPHRTAPPPNQRSRLLSNEENETVFKALKPKCQSQATAVVEMYGTVPPHHNVWSKLLCGVVTYTKDNNRKSYFIQVFDMTMKNMFYEQEIYKEFKYHVSKEFFHQYEGDERTIGLNFADAEEALIFSGAVNGIIRTRQKKREERKRQVILDSQKSMKQQYNIKQQEQHRHQQELQQQQQLSQQQKHKNEQPEKYKTLRGMKNLRKEMSKFATVGREKKPRKALDIGAPTNFVHVSHAGLDSQFGINEEVEKLLNNLGLENKPENQAFAYDFIEKNVGGNMEEVRRMNQKLSTRRVLDSTPPAKTTLAPHRGPPPPPPGRSQKAGPPPPPPNTHSPNAGGGRSVLASGGRPLPSPPNRAGGSSYLHSFNGERSPTSRHPPAPPPPVRGASSPSMQPKSGSSPPPPPVPKSGSGPPPPLPKSGSGPPNPPMPKSGSGPPPPPMPKSGSGPPPPPPMPNSGIVPSSPPMSINGQSPQRPPPPSRGNGSGPPPPPIPESIGRVASSDPRSALLEQIRGGTGGLKHVDPNSTREAPKDSRSELLESIRAREFNLHQVKRDERKDSVSSDSPLGLEGWALDLHKALQKREQFIQSEDSNSEADDDDDEWDDSD